MAPYKIGDRLKCIRWDGHVFTRSHVYVVQGMDGDIAQVPRDDFSKSHIRIAGILPSFMGKYFINLGPKPSTEDGADEYDDIMKAQELMK